MKSSLFHNVSLDSVTLVAVELDKLVSEAKALPIIKDDQYYNGREDGITLKCAETDRQVSFAEYRCSDNVVVYYGALKDFDEAGCVNEDCWQAHQFKFFDPTPAGFAKAAKFMLHHLTKK